MGNGNVCSNCGKNNSDASNFCSSCGSPLGGEDSNYNVQTTNIPKIDNNDPIKDESTRKNSWDPDGNIIGIIAIVLLFGSEIIAQVISIIIPGVSGYMYQGLLAFFYLLTVGIIIRGRKRFPKNTIFKVLLWIVIISFLAGILGAIVVIFLFYAIMPKNV